MQDVCSSSLADIVLHRACIPCFPVSSSTAASQEDVLDPELFICPVYVE